MREHVTDVLRASPTSLRFLLRKLSTRFERRIHIQLHLQIENYLKQRPPFNGYMFVRQDKIPDQLKLCSVRILRRRMVRYLSNGANFTRIGDNDEDCSRCLCVILSLLFSDDYTIQFSMTLGTYGTLNYLHVF